jgi:hypothetical protein
MKKNLKDFSWDELNDAFSPKEMQRQGAIIGGKIGGASNSKSGHMKRIQKENAHIGGKIMGSIIGKKYGAKALSKTTFEQRSKGGKESHRKHVESGHWRNYIMLGAAASTKARIDRGLENKKKIIDSIKSDTFTTSEARKACEKFEYKSWKSLLKESKLVKQIYKGMNQFDPSIYKKVK